MTELRWRKSSRSGKEGNCVELAWRKSSRSGQEGNCVELVWRKSSHSGEEGNCVELAYSPGAVRDSKNVADPALSIGDMPAFLRAIKGGRFDRR
jgi:hypothetical protein